MFKTLPYRLQRSSISSLEEPRGILVIKILLLFLLSKGTFDLGVSAAAVSALETTSTGLTFSGVVSLGLSDMASDERENVFAANRIQHVRMTMRHD